MVVQESVDLYLAKNLTCPDFGLRVEQEQSEPGPVPRVTVDLRGHTLRRPGKNISTARGITAFGYPGQAEVKVSNGALKNWDMAVGGDTSTQVKGVALLSNRIGFACNGLEYSWRWPVGA